MDRLYDQCYAGMILRILQNTEQEILNKILDNENILKYEILGSETHKKLIESDKYMIEDFPHMTNEKKVFKIYDNYVIYHLI